MLRIAVSSICYYREIFPADTFETRDGFGVNVHCLNSDGKARSEASERCVEDVKHLCDWLEQGVFDALSKKYLSSLCFIVGTRRSGESKKAGTENVPLESWTFSFTYPTASTIAMNGKPCTPAHLKREAIRLIHRLIDLSSTLSELPEEKWLTMKLKYNEAITPPNYEPKNFRAEENPAVHAVQRDSEAGNIYINVGKLHSKSISLQLFYEGIDDYDALLREQPLITPARVPAMPDDGMTTSLNRKKAEKRIPPSQRESSAVKSHKRFTEDRSYKRILHALKTEKPEVKSFARRLMIPSKKVREVFQHCVEEGLLFQDRRGRYEIVEDFDTNDLPRNVSQKYVTPKANGVAASRRFETRSSDVMSTA
eukprot:scaffold774_cov248-Pinguiococcus_pyrenoidosus.AAC.20